MNEDIMFIGDIHGKNKTPLNRLKDYNDDLFKKMEWLVSYCNANQIRYCIHLGDIHDKTEASDEWKNRFIQIWRQYNGKFYTIFGNHDIPYNEESLYTKTCLRNLELSGVIEVLREPLIIDDVSIVPLSLDLAKSKEIIKYSIKNNIGLHLIFVGHHFYEFGLNRKAGFVEEDFKDISSRVDLVLGHDHKQYETKFVNQMMILRPGSLMRTELSEATINMVPRVLVLDRDLGFQYVQVPHRDINEIYNVQEYYSKKQNAKYFKQTINALENMNKYLDRKSESSILCSEALKELGCPQPEFDYLKAVYQQCGQEF